MQPHLRIALRHAFGDSFGLRIAALDSLDRISRVGWLVVPAPFNLATDAAREGIEQLLAKMALGQGL